MVTKFKLALASDEEKFKWIKDHLYVAIVCDVLDILGLQEPGYAPTFETA